MYDLVVVGCGPAGMTAAIYGKRANLNVLLLDKLAPGGQIVNTYEIENYPSAGRISGADLAIKMFEHTQLLDIPMEYATVYEICNEGSLKRIRCTEQTEFLTKAVILATGTKPRMLHVANEELFLGNGISYCAICDGAQYQGRDVIVIGGGNSAVEEAVYLAGFANQVTVVTLYALTADAASCDQLRRMKNVKILEYFDIQAFLPGDSFTGMTIQSTQTGEVRTILADGAFEYIGLEPLTQNFAELGVLNKQGYVQVNEKMETTVPGIFAAGDVTEKTLRQVVTACNDGAIAAQSAANFIKRSSV